MQAIEFETDIDTNNEIHLKLPDALKGAHARVIVLVDTEKPAKGGNLDEFLASLPPAAEGRDRQEIAAEVKALRAEWDR
jgi:hypothetical protein